MSKTVISLTTIPPRMGDINETLSSLINQSEPANKIYLNIPRRYNRFKQDTYNLSKVPSNVEIVICDFDYGPATKLLPTLEKFKNENLNIIYCDDDRIYPNNWVECLKKNSKIYPETCIAVSGGLISQVELQFSLKTKPKLKILAPIYRKLYTLKKQRPQPNSIVDIAGGYGGVLVKPYFFDDEVFKIPNQFLTVDDTWISGHLRRRGIDVFQIDGVQTPKSLRISEHHALQKINFGNKSQNEIDVECIKYFRQNFGIWLDK